MNGLLVRVGIDTTCGGWNSPAGSQTGDYLYVPIPESEGRLSAAFPVRRYDELANALRRMGNNLPAHLQGRAMHLDPDFATLTYGDAGQRGAQIRSLKQGDFIAFYGAFGEFDQGRTKLIYALFGFFTIERIAKAVDIPVELRSYNAHTRQELRADSDDIVVLAFKKSSGRLKRLVPIGEYRDRAYRVTPSLLSAWGGLSVKNGYIQRSVALPRFLNPPAFLEWFAALREPLVSNNWEE